MRYQITILMLLLTAASCFAQSNNEEYNKLLKTSKKQNITHVKISIGLGFSTLDNYFARTGYAFHDPNLGFTSDDSSFEKGALLIHANAAISIDVIETKHIFFNVNGGYTYGYLPNKKSKTTPSYLAGFDLPAIDKESGSYRLKSYDFSAKLGFGDENIKLYLVAGLGSYNFQEMTYLKSSMPDPTTNVSYPTEIWDTGSLKLNYIETGIGLRIGNNRKKTTFDISACKLSPGNDFYNNTDPPGLVTALTRFGKYAYQYPSLPMVFSATLTRRGKYEVRADFKKLREKDFTGKNANAFSMTFSKHFDFYNKKKK